MKYLALCVSQPRGVQVRLYLDTCFWTLPQNVLLCSLQPIRNIFKSPVVQAFRIRKAYACAQRVLNITTRNKLFDASTTLAYVVTVLHALLINKVQERAPFCVTLFADIMKWNIVQLCRLSKNVTAHEVLGCIDIVNQKIF